jgi:hypothetical protein
MSVSKITILGIAGPTAKKVADLHLADSLDLSVLRTLFSSDLRQAPVYGVIELIEHWVSAKFIVDGVRKEGWIKDLKVHEDDSTAASFLIATRVEEMDDGSLLSQHAWLSFSLLLTAWLKLLHDEQFKWLEHKLCLVRITPLAPSPSDDEYSLDSTAI